MALPRRQSGPLQWADTGRGIRRRRCRRLANADSAPAPEHDAAAAAPQRAAAVRRAWAAATVRQYQRYFVYRRVTAVEFEARPQAAEIQCP